MENDHIMSPVELIMCSFVHRFSKVFDGHGGVITRMRAVGGSKAVPERPVVPEAVPTQRFQHPFWWLNPGQKSHVHQQTFMSAELSS